MSYVVVRELLDPNEQTYIARDRSDINPRAKEAEELGTFPGLV